MSRHPLLAAGRRSQSGARRFVARFNLRSALSAGKSLALAQIRRDQIVVNRPGNGVTARAQQESVGRPWAAARQEFLPSLSRATPPSEPPPGHCGSDCPTRPQQTWRRDGSRRGGPPTDSETGAESGGRHRRRANTAAAINTGPGADTAGRSRLTVCTSSHHQHQRRHQHQWPARRSGRRDEPSRRLQPRMTN